MKKVFISIISCVLVLFTVSFFTNAKANENTDANTEALNLFTKFYNEGSYKKDTKIYINENVLEEVEDYFHSNITILERTTYYDGDELWMSNENGYSGYGTKDGKLTRFTVSRSREKGDESTSSIEGGMEAYYCTLDDFVKGTHDSTHVNSPITLNEGWENVNGVLVSYSKDVFQGYRLFTAPLWLYTEESKNYIDFSLATLEEEVLDTKEGASNLTRLVMKLWTSKLDSAKFNSTETFEVGNQTHYLFSKAYVYTDYITDLEGNGTENDPYLIQSDEDWVTFGEHGANKYKFNGEYVKLTTNINTNKRIFVDANHGFRGTLDGNDKIVTANIVNENASENRFGIFGVTGRGSVVKNLTIEGSVTSAGAYVGGLAGLLYGSAYNCHNKATISGGTNGVVGGIAGKAYSTTIDSCTNSGAISATGKFVGGIAGEIEQESSYSAFKISNCHNTNEAVVASSFASDNATVGGIIGVAKNKGTIEKCINSADISISSTRLGGIIGAISSSNLEIKNCVNNGSLSAKKTAAGIAGISEGGTKEGSLILFDSCENHGDIKVTDKAGYNAGILGYTRSYCKFIDNKVDTTITITAKTNSGYIYGDVDTTKCTLSGNNPEANKLG